jgi:1-acyl-sn-glycerol-3-phosphate acyltransferase
MTARPNDLVPPTLGSWLLYEGSRALTATLLTIGFSLRYRRGQNTPKTGPLLIIANHQSFLDPTIVAQGFERHLVYLARKTLFRNAFFRALIRGLNAVPIDQDGIGKDGLKIILDQLALGKAVLVFPEGTRTPDGRIYPLRPGIHLLIKRTTAPIIPVGLAGAYDAWPSWRSYPIPAPLFLPPSPRTIGLAVGEPLDPRLYAAMDRDRAMAALGDELEKIHGQAELLRRK